MSVIAECHLATGDILYREGDANHCVYIIVTGEVVLFRGYGNDRVDCERRGAGAILGEVSILTGRPRAVTVEAVTNCHVLRLPAQMIQEQLASLDPVLRACVETSIGFAGRYFGATGDNGGGEAVPPSLPNMQDVVDKLRFELDILKGLDNGDFSMVYQPIVELETGRIAGVEALMRWTHPELGAVPPDRFIAVAEAMGAIDRITEFALKEACATVGRMKRAGVADDGFFFSVNVSGQDVGRDGFADILAHLLDQNDLSAACLKLELTETALVPDSDGAEQTLTQIEALGCGISIDDFGTGFSNLAYLKALPLSAIKIDRAFAGDAHENAVSRGIVRMLVGLGTELGVDIVAEGLEALEDVDILRQLGCRYAQGYYFYRPLPEAEVFEVLRETSRFVA